MGSLKADRTRKARGASADIDSALAEFSHLASSDPGHLIQRINDVLAIAIGHGAAFGYEMGRLEGGLTPWE